MPVCITGMHRSGTSMVAHLMYQAGVYLGDEKNMMTRQFDNPEGHWENLKFVSLNDDILNTMGGAWDFPPDASESWRSSDELPGLIDRAKKLIAEFAGQQVWGWKDPRHALTHSFWEPILPDAKLIICVRNPLEVITSLRRRNHLSYQLCLSLWETYNRNLLGLAERTNCVVTHYDSFFDKPGAEIARLLEFIDFNVNEETLERCSSVIKAGLYHNRFTTQNLVEAKVPPEILELYHALCVKAGVAAILPGRAAASAVGSKVCEGLAGGVSSNGHKNHSNSGPSLDTNVIEMGLLQADMQKMGEALQSLSSTLESHLSKDMQYVGKTLETLTAELQRQGEKVSEIEKQLNAAKVGPSGNGRESSSGREGAETQPATAPVAMKSAPASAQETAAAEMAKERERVRLNEAVYKAVLARVPKEATAIVISRGDNDLLNLAGRRAWHFPQTEEGWYAGEYPSDSAEAVRQLESLRKKGGDYLVIPGPSVWWLDFYKELREHLDKQHRCVWRHEWCVIYQLVKPAAETGFKGPDEVTPETVSRARLRAFLSTDARLTFRKTEAPLVSIVIPTYNQAHYTFAALESLLLTAAPTIPFELIVVDNNSRDETRTLLDRVDNVVTHFNEENLGFGAACNTGAGLARGQYVCFLNSDTQVGHGWLDALLKTAKDYPKCGAVGAKLVHQSGRLQEAGGIIWRDGSGAGYGRGDNPFAPEYNYVREVDYCSAACLLVPRDLFHLVGGFDDRYAPAYYEDADLCFAIREAGYKVVYQPKAIVIHAEFGSSDRAARAIELQVLNRSKFVEKWGCCLSDKLSPGSENLLAGRDNRPGRRVLVADDRIPDPALGSGFPRTRALLDALVGLGYVVTFLPLTDQTPCEVVAEELRQAGVEILSGVQRIRTTLQERACLYDAAIVSRPHNAWTLAVLRQANPKLAIIYDAEAVYAAREALRARVMGEPLPAEEVEEEVRGEFAQAALADVVMTVSEAERHLFNEHLSGSTPVVVWGHSLSPRRDVPGFKERRDLLFVGALFTPPNDDALLHFLDGTFQSIRGRLGCRFLIVGASPSAELAEASAATEGVELKGFIEDLRTVYDGCRVFVAPHRFAAGVPLKVIEAMSHGVPCVVSKLLAEQLDITDGVEALVAASKQEFAEKVARLYRDRRLWEEVQGRALLFTERRYSTDPMLRLLGDYIESAIAAKSHAVVVAHSA